MDDGPDPPTANNPNVDVMDVSPAAPPDPTSPPTNPDDSPPADPLPAPPQVPPPAHPPVDPTPNPAQDLSADPVVEPAVTAPPVAAILADDPGARPPPRSHPNPSPSPNPPQPPATPTISSAAAGVSPAVPEEEKLDTEFTYVLRRYPSIQENKVYSPWHNFGYFRWRLLIFPKGNQNSNHDLSVYLECGGPSHLPSAADRTVQAQYGQHHHASPNGKEAAVASGPAMQWSRPAKFSLHLVHPASSVAKAAMAREFDLVEQDQTLSDLDVSESNVTSNVTMTPAVPGSDGATAGATTVTSVGNVVGTARPDLMKETSHVFRETASDWGFLEFAPFAHLQPMQYADDDMNVVIMVRIHLQENLNEAMFSNTVAWDSRKETGFVGFKNQGATCYMNSLLQTLYMLSAFRKAVYNMPLPELGNENSGSELSYALQKVFYELQFSPTVVKTKKLTESFGWDTTDAFTQHDVQELKLILCDELAEKMKKIAPNQQNTLSTLFQGKLRNYIECVNVDYTSTREEHFSDLSLNVKGCRNIYESFEKYVEVEMMEGDNKYRADGYEELQDARKGVKFLQLPPVLQLHLKRFEYDFTRYAMVKINDRYEFGPELDLSQFVEKSDGDDIYVLHSVLVHIGDVNGGHYHAFIRPEIDVSTEGSKKPPHWLKFDDETVSPAAEEAAIQENFGVGGERDLAGKRGTGMEDDLGNGGINGGQTPPPSVFQARNRNYQSRRFSNAYMLQYLRKSDVPYLLKPQDHSDVPKELADCITKEREEEEQRKRDKMEQHLYMNIAVAVSTDMAEHHGSDLVQWDKVRSLRVKRVLQLGELKLRLQNEGIVQDARRMRLWKCSGRQNDTIRPDSLVALGIDTQPISDTNSRDHMNQTYNVSLYSGRHGYYGHEDVVRMYAEDFCSTYCLRAGHAYADFTEHFDGWSRDHRNGRILPDDNQNSSEMETDPVKPATESRMPLFQLAFGKEVLLFLKYYSPRPVPRLQWLGHFVIDRASTVRDLHPLLKEAFAAYRKMDPSIPPISDGADITVYEEVSATNVAHLSPSKTLEDQRIPFESGSGDILVFQQAVNSSQEENSQLTGVELIDGAHDEMEWNGTQQISSGDGTDLPLGGRPLPTVNDYYEYLTHRIKIEFKDKYAVGGPDEGKSIFFEMLRKDTYVTARRVLAGALGEDVNHDYIRFFTHDYNRDAAAQEPLRLGDAEELQRVLPMHNMVTTGQPDYRILWYERTEYHISEFDKKDEVRVVWRQDGGARATPYSGSGGAVQEVGSTYPSGDPIIRADISVSVPEEDDARAMNGTTGSNGPSTTITGGTASGDGSKTFSVLVPVMSKYADVMNQVRLKLHISSDVSVRMFEVKNSKIFRFISPDESVSPLMTGSHDCGAELRAEPVPEDETEEALGSEYELIRVLHLAKDKQPRSWRGLTFFGVPFVIKVRKEGETVGAIRKRVQNKLGVPQEEFDQWPLAEILQVNVEYLNEVDAMYIPRARVPLEFFSLAIEHKSTAPAKKTPAMSRYADKPLKIRS